MIYQYKCKECGKEFEYSQSINSEALTKWPEDIKGHDDGCDGEVFRKITRGVGVILKGSGFYETDYVRNKTTPNESSSVVKYE